MTCDKSKKLEITEMFAGTMGMKYFSEEEMYERVKSLAAVFAPELCQKCLRDIVKSMREIV